MFALSVLFILHVLLFHFLLLSLFVSFIVSIAIISIYFFLWMLIYFFFFIYLFIFIWHKNIWLDLYLMWKCLYNFRYVLIFLFFSLVFHFISNHPIWFAFILFKHFTSILCKSKIHVDGFCFFFVFPCDDLITPIGFLVLCNFLSFLRFLVNLFIVWMKGRYTFNPPLQF